MAYESEERSESVRSLIGDVLDEETTREKIRQLVSSAFELNRLADAFCPNCRKRVRAEVPDVRAQAQVLMDMIEQANGRPGTAQVEDAGVNLIVERWSPDGGSSDPDELPPGA